MRIVSVIIFILLLLGCGQQTAPIIRLAVKERQIAVDGKTATVYSVEQPDGTFGFTARKGQLISIELQNRIVFPTSIHWHGLFLPNDQDGVAFVTQLPIYPGENYRYRFPLKQSGTFWMHAHYALEQQNQLGAPLILQGNRDASIADQEVIFFLTDFSFKKPEEIMQELTNMSMSEHNDLVEVQYDAFLANWRTLEDPDIIRVKPASRVRLRIINGSSATNFFISSGNLQANAIAIDGNEIEPLTGTNFELAVAQRIDLLVQLPQDEGVFPLLAQGEGTNMQTGIILATPNASIPKLGSRTTQAAGALTNRDEERYRSLSSLEPRKIDREIAMELDGSMVPYIWTINKQAWPEVTPLLVKKGERVRVTFTNNSTMSHPMHLHGHTFQVTQMNNKTIKGAMRDTVLVLSKSTLAIEFDADNPGVWPFHCHVLYHQESGMMTLLRYD